VASISELVARELTSLQRFRVLLEQERQALTGVQADALPSIVDEKAKLAASLSALEASRDELLVQAGGPKGRAGMEAWLKKCPNPATENQRWSELLDLAAKARQENETNGRLINLLLKQNQDALSILLSGGGGSIYGPDGQQRNLTGNRSLGSA
jgi:flagellar biosynthesis protein FlgN